MVFVGTSGWNYSHWKKVFYPDGLPQREWLEYYLRFFSCVELNVTFYRLVKQATFKNWYGRTPKNFCFAVKGSRFITHIKRLKDTKEALDLFVKNATGLKEKLALILWQLPPGFKKDINRLTIFLNLLKKTKLRHCFEFRNESWFNEEVYRLLEEYNFSLCIAHSARFPCEKVVTADYLYLRFHGGDSLYSSNYSDKELKAWAKFARQFKKEKDIFVFFNNDSQGFAVKNALRFKELLS
ncbi:MAG: DUF72 domain-containing protein [Candidatus Omnitrophica bacterium]|nr:DUF72 domain-containing protein [Candidatus Omnitrophota bacterium]